jgi:hypothetical protein
MAKDLRDASEPERRDVATSGGVAGANAPVLAQGKVQKGDGNAAASSAPKEGLDAEGKSAKIVNPALRGDASVPYVDEEGNLQSEDFAAGEVHYVDEATANLKFGGVDMFVDPPEDNE